MPLCRNGHMFHLGCCLEHLKVRQDNKQRWDCPFCRSSDIRLSPANFEAVGFGPVGGMRWGAGLIQSGGSVGIQRILVYLGR